MHAPQHSRLQRKYFYLNGSIPGFNKTLIGFNKNVGVRRLTPTYGTAPDLNPRCLLAGRVLSGHPLDPGPFADAAHRCPAVPIRQRGLRNSPLLHKDSDSPRPSSAAGFRSSANSAGPYFHRLRADHSLRDASPGEKTNHSIHPHFHTGDFIAHRINIRKQDYKSLSNTIYLKTTAVIT